MSRSWQWMFLAVLALVFVGCAKPRLGLAEQDLRAAGLQARQSALDSPDLSRDGREFLALHGLVELTPQAIWERMQEQAQSGVFTPSARDLADLAERCFQQALSQKQDEQEVRRHHLSSAFLAYAALFGEGAGANLDPYDPRFRRAADSYALSLAALCEWLWSERAQLREGLPANWIGGDMLLVGEAGGMNWPMESAVGARAADTHAATGFESHGRFPGLGAPLVLDWPASQWNGHHEPREAQIRPATLMLFGETSIKSAFEGASPVRCRIRLIDPLAGRSMTIGGRTVPVAADLGLPLALLLEQGERVDGMAGLMKAESFGDHTGLYTLGPYRPGAVPIVFVHGLMSRPLTWLPLCATLLADERLARETQIWFFLYPTGNPILESAAILRESLAGARARFDPENRDPAFSQMVVVGHSMGGVLSRLMVQSSGDHLIQTVFGRPLAEVKLAAADEAAVLRLLTFSAARDCERAIFMAAPHRGAKMADAGIARFASSLVKLPSDLATTTLRIRESAGPDNVLDRILPAGHAATGIDSLSENNPVLLATLELPIEVPFHTVAGRRSAKEDGDSVVPLKSALLEGATSELIIESDHAVHTRAPAISEIRRILHAHLDLHRRAGSN